jgi:ABC-type oligopeptide transport system substrate-binding subunit
MKFHWLLALALCAAPEVHAAHAYSQFGDIKYPAGFPHFEWVNPKAPKGGDIELVPPLRITNFDKYNPFTLKGTAPPGTGLLFESLLTGTMDEPTTAYGLLAEDVEVAADGLSATFRLNPAARFHDGTPVMAADVKHSFDMLMSKQAAPQYRVIFSDVTQAAILGPRTVRADFALIRKRLDVFDFDLFTVRVPGSEAPGSELLDRYGSESADTEGSSDRSRTTPAGWSRPATPRPLTLGVTGCGWLGEPCVS